MGYPSRAYKRTGDPVSGNRETSYENTTYARTLTEKVSKLLGYPVRFEPLPRMDNAVKVRVHTSEEMLRSQCAQYHHRRLMFTEKVPGTTAAMEAYLLRNDPQYNDRPQFVKNDDKTSALGDCVTYAAIYLKNRRVSASGGAPFQFDRTKPAPTRRQGVVRQNFAIV